MAGDKIANDASNGSITTKDGVVMTKSDVEFLMACIQNTTGGTLLVDQVGVANALNMKNPRSVGNKIGIIKKKYNLPLGTGSGKSTTDGGSPTVPKTTPKTTPKTIKKPATPRKKKAAMSAKEVEEETVKDEEGDEHLDVEDPMESDVEEDAEEE